MEAEDGTGQSLKAVLKIDVGDGEDKKKKKGRITYFFSTALHMFQNRILGCAGLRSERRKLCGACGVKKMECSLTMTLPVTVGRGQGLYLEAQLHAVL